MEQFETAEPSFIRAAARHSGPVAPGDEAIATCARAIASDAYQGHDLAKLHYDRAFEYHAKGDEDRAIAGYSEAISLDPNYALAFHGRANSWQAKRDKRSQHRRLQRVDPPRP